MSRVVMSSQRHSRVQTERKADLFLTQLGSPGNNRSASRVFGVDDASPCIEEVVLTYSHVIRAFFRRWVAPIKMRFLIGMMMSRLSQAARGCWRLLEAERLQRRGQGSHLREISGRAAWKRAECREREAGITGRGAAVVTSLARKNPSVCSGYGWLFHTG
jgi:hypothetical protein